MSCHCVAVSTGKPCRNRAQPGSQFCRVHQSCRQITSDVAALCQCIASSTGKPCQRPPKSGSRFCSVHQSCRQPVGAGAEVKQEPSEHPLMHIDPLMRLIASYVPTYRVDLVVVIPTGYKYREPDRVERTVDFIDEKTFEYYADNRFTRLTGLPSFIQSLRITDEQRDRLSRIVVKQVSARDTADYQVPPIPSSESLRKIATQLTNITRHLVRMCDCRVKVELEYIDHNWVGYKIIYGHGLYPLPLQGHHNWSLAVFTDEPRLFDYEKIRKYIEPELSGLTKIILLSQI